MDKLRRRIEAITNGMEDFNVIPVKYMRDLLPLLKEAEEEWRKMLAALDAHRQMVHNSTVELSTLKAEVKE